jgi:transposase
MSKMVFDNPQKKIDEIQEFLRQNPAGRFSHRLHVIILLLNGFPRKKIKELYGDSIRAIQYWWQHYNKFGPEGLRETPRPGRPAKITAAILAQLADDLRRNPAEFSYSQGYWDGPLLRHHLKNQYQVEITVRHCQRLLHKMGFSLQKPRPKMAGSSVVEAEAFKKNFRISG